MVSPQPRLPLRRGEEKRTTLPIAARTPSATIALTPRGHQSFRPTNGDQTAINLPPLIPIRPANIIGIEAGMATHYVARELIALGHESPI
jgi:hypothetical protein